LEVRRTPRLLAAWASLPGTRHSMRRQRSTERARLPRGKVEPRRRARAHTARPRCPSWRGAAAPGRARAQPHTCSRHARVGVVAFVVAEATRLVPVGGAPACSRHGALRARAQPGAALRAPCARRASYTPQSLQGALLLLLQGQGSARCQQPPHTHTPVPHESMSKASARPASCTAARNVASAVGLRQMLPACAGGWVCAMCAGGWVHARV
jgi:hypothetical protein